MTVADPPVDTYATQKDLQVLRAQLSAEFHKEIGELSKTILRVAVIMAAAFVTVIVAVALAT